MRIAISVKIIGMMELHIPEINIGCVAAIYYVGRIAMQADDTAIIAIFQGNSALSKGIFAKKKNKKKEKIAYWFHHKHSN
jgi:pyruvate/2-oxoacid:ferredoxin oxidoreductase beta subunit